MLLGHCCAIFKLRSVVLLVRDGLTVLRWRRIGRNHVAEIVGQLSGREFVNCKIKVVAHAPNYTGVSVNGFGLQAFELEVLLVGAVRTGK